MRKIKTYFHQKNMCADSNLFFGYYCSFHNSKTTIVFMKYFYWTSHILHTFWITSHTQCCNLDILDKNHRKLFTAIITTINFTYVVKTTIVSLELIERKWTFCFGRTWLVCSPIKRNLVSLTFRITNLILIKCYNCWLRQTQSFTHFLKIIQGLFFIYFRPFSIKH